MSQIEKILHRSPASDAAESERVRSLAVARLSTMSAHPEVGGTASLTGAPPIVVEGVEGVDPADEPPVTRYRPGRAGRDRTGGGIRRGGHDLAGDR